VITGVVTPNRDAVIRLTLHDSNGQPHDIDAIVDTGFNGNLTLPPQLINSLGLTWLRVARAFLADGSEIITNVYEINLLWDGQLVSISVSEADADPLVGMSLMYGFELLMPILDGATFTLRRITTP
jgi:clan AA aspartic protease